MAVKRKWDILSKEKRQESIDELIYFFDKERDEEIGIIAAGALLDHFLEYLGAELYNKGVEDTLNFMKARMESMELDIDVMLKK